MAGHMLKTPQRNTMYVDMSHHIALYQQNIEIETFSPFMKLCDDL